MLGAWGLEFGAYRFRGLVTSCGECAGWVLITYAAAAYASWCPARQPRETDNRLLTQALATQFSLTTQFRTLGP